MTHELSELAGIQYAGTSGGSHDCLDAVMRFIQFGDCVERVCILTTGSRHGLLLFGGSGDCTGIKPGFASGYSGSGPSAFSYSLQLLSAHGARIDEHEVPEALLRRLGESALTRADLALIQDAVPDIAAQWQDYIFERDWVRRSDGTLWKEFPEVIPFAVIDNRIGDIVISFWTDPDARLLAGYRRLEDIVRARTGLQEHGQKLFTKAFNGPESPLIWPDGIEAECVARANLFTGAFGAHRNPRAHREQGVRSGRALSELLLLNHLFLLEAEATARPPLNA